VSGHGSLLTVIPEKIIAYGNETRAASQNKGLSPQGRNDREEGKKRLEFKNQIASLRSQ
jgi:hypothetical protein